VTASERLLQEFESLRFEFRPEVGEPRHVAARLGEARHDAGRHGIPEHCGDDRNCLGRLLGRQGPRRAGGDDDFRLESNKLSSEARQPFLLSLSKLVRDDEISPLHIAELTQAITKRFDQVGFEG